MKTPLKLLALAGLGLSACEPYPPPPVYPPPPAAVPYGAAAVPYGAPMVTTANKAPFGTYLVDGSGRSLYILEGTRMPGGTNRCLGDCLRAWPPMGASGPPRAGGAVDPARLAVVPGPMGPQVAYAGWPLFHYQQDHLPADTVGQHVTDRWGTWHLLSTTGEPIRPAGGY